MIYYALYVGFNCILASQVLKLVWLYWIRRPDSDFDVGLPTFLGKWITSIWCLIQGPKIMMKAYVKAAGKPFAIPAFSNCYICISDARHISELRSAPSDQLSFYGFLQQVVWPQHTRISALRESDPAKNISTLALTKGLRSELPALRNGLQERLAMAFKREVSRSTGSNGWMRMAAGAATYRIAGDLNCFVILGEKLSSDSTLAQATMQFVYDAAITCELMRFTPSIIRSPVSFVSMYWSGAVKIVRERISCEIRERLRSRSSAEDADTGLLDCITWTINAFRQSNEMSVTGIRERIMGFLFASAHQIPPLVASSLYRLCRHPEYLRPLQEEVSCMTENATSGPRREDTPLLDSFLKETARLHPLQITGMNRKVMTPFVFSDGTRVPVGNTVCIPQQAIMQDPQNFPNPLEFQGFRFVTRRDGVVTSTSRLSHPSPLFPIWGSVSSACPARFYVSMVVKLILVHVIKHYDIKLADEDAKPQFSWGINMVTHPSLTFLIRERET